MPNLKATQVELYQGLEARSVSGWPSVNFDLMGLLGILGRFMPPGFYYRQTPMQSLTGRRCNGRRSKPAVSTGSAGFCNSARVAAYPQQPLILAHPV